MLSFQRGGLYRDLILALQMDAAATAREICPLLHGKGTSRWARGMLRIVTMPAILISAGPSEPRPVRLSDRAHTPHSTSAPFHLGHAHEIIW